MPYGAKYRKPQPVPADNGQPQGMSPMLGPMANPEVQPELRAPQMQGPEMPMPGGAPPSMMTPMAPIGTLEDLLFPNQVPEYGAQGPMKRKIYG